MINKKYIKGLYGIVDSSFKFKKPLPEIAFELLLGGCQIIQLRVKEERHGLWDDKVFKTAQSIIEFKKRFDFTFIINDYVDVAAEVEADGIHVGSNDMPIPEIKKRVGDRLIVGYSSHSVEEAFKAKEKGADYVAFGAIFPTKTKGPGHPVQGTKKLATLVDKIDIPVVAIGGINRNNIDELLSTGVSSVAMISALIGAKDTINEAKWFKGKITERNG